MKNRSETNLLSLIIGGASIGALYLYLRVKRREKINLKSAQKIYYTWGYNEGSHDTYDFITKILGVKEN